VNRPFARYLAQRHCQLQEGDFELFIAPPTPNELASGAVAMDVCAAVRGWPLATTERQQAVMKRLLPVYRAVFTVR